MLITAKDIIYTEVEMPEDLFVNEPVDITDETIRERMLMYGKEASNRKQEIDRQHHTIPNQRNQRPKDKHRGNVYPKIPYQLYIGQPMFSPKSSIISL